MAAATITSFTSILRARGGSSLGAVGCALVSAVFSAHAEVVPFEKMNRADQLRILRARGGSSSVGLFQQRQAGYSPRTRR